MTTIETPTFAEKIEEIVADAVARAQAAVADDAAPAETETGRAWHGPLAWQGVQTGDGRVMREITWRTLPLPLKWQPADLPGHDESVIVGRIDSIEARDDGSLWGTGVFDSSDDAVEAARLVEERMLRGVSIDPGGIKSDDVIYHEDSDTLEFLSYEIGAATLVAIPAFADAWVVLDGMDDPAPSGEPGDEDEPEPAPPEGEDETEPIPVAAGGGAAALSALLASAAPVTTDAPPAAYFADPELDRPRGCHVEPPDEHGWQRVWGHLSWWGQCHTGSPTGSCVTVPRGCTEHGAFANTDGRGVLVDSGETIPTGPIVVSADHAALSLGWVAAKSHYDHTGLAVADVAVGEDAHGIWIAGIVRPGTDSTLVHVLRASGPSGDWRAIGGRLQLVAILSVNTEGYPAIAASIDRGQIVSLVSLVAGAETVPCPCGSTSGPCSCSEDGPETPSAAAGAVSAALSALSDLGVDLDALRALSAAHRSETIRRMEESLGLPSREQRASELAASLGLPGD